MLDFAGRWGKERTPQRRAAAPSARTCARAARAGPGPDAATVLHVGTPGFASPSGEVWAVHTGWSGNHTHYAERLSTGEQVIGGGELLLPGEIVLAPGRVVHLAVDLRRRTASAWTRWPAASTATCAPATSTRRPTRPVTLNVWEAVYFDHDLDRAGRPGRAGGRPRGRALRARRRLVRRPPRRPRRAGRLDRSRRTSGRTGCTRWSTRCTELGMQFGLWFEPEMINLDSDAARAHPEWVMATGDRLPVESRRPAGDQPRHSRVLRLHPRRDLRDPRRVRDRLHQVGPQPRPDRRRHPADRPARGARADRWRSTGWWTSSRPRTPGWRSSPAPPAAPGSTWACWSAPTGSGSRTASTRWSDSRCTAGPPS